MIQEAAVLPTSQFPTLKAAGTEEAEPSRKPDPDNNPPPSTLPPPVPETFVVELEKGAVTKVGLSVGRFGNPNYPQALKVKAVEEGLARIYNSTAPDHLQIKAGDCIVEVNGVSEDSGKMLERVKGDQSLRFVIQHEA